MTSDRFNRALQAIDAANAEDPNREEWEGALHPKELLYGRRMTGCLERLCPAASEALRLAARGQHIRRWEIPRSDYPATREGYLRWRTRLYGFHGDQLGLIMAMAGYDEDSIRRTKRLLSKRDLRTDPESQTLEDTACLVFLEYYFAPFAAGQDESKLVDIVRKTWRKMSDAARVRALELALPGHLGAVVAKALETVAP
ncbi:MULTISPECIES: DUF4202 domain-containing protein [Methylococcus]|uniref:DUF4202 domain-containing protein n=1 Tax=Methylococcus capsulatus TaxID=414 RepID=A0ABZ2F4D8_METCP|nr:MULTISPECIES: DUF4202 domain-containing protein [Methylococcus]MDF9392119.1 DUF4202 domain-containing protein [Methylococcus capsulatus]